MSTNIVIICCSFLVGWECAQFHSQQPRRPQKTTPPRSLT